MPICHPQKNEACKDKIKDARDVNANKKYRQLRKKEKHANKQQAWIFLCFLDVSLPLEYENIDLSFPSVCLPFVVCHMFVSVSIFIRQKIF